MLKPKIIVSTPTPEQAAQHQTTLKLQKLGGKFWCTPDNKKHRFYLDKFPGAFYDFDRDTLVVERGMDAVAIIREIEAVKI